VIVDCCWALLLFVALLRLFLWIVGQLEELDMSQTAGDDIYDNYLNIH
jgi:protein-S-isoprenylcysteine O-methyltransferase Ste14